jgi:hypothetical protein
MIGVADEPPGDDLAMFLHLYDCAAIYKTETHAMAQRFFAQLDFLTV